MTNKLNPRQELFCQLYVSKGEFFGNGVQSYVEAYDIDTSKKGWYKVAKSAASRLLTNVNLLEYIDSLLEEQILNNQFVDKQLAFLITQDADFSTKMRAIQEYNKLQARITDKLDLTSKGKEVTNIALVEFFDAKRKKDNKE